MGVRSPAARDRLSLWHVYTARRTDEAAEAAWQDGLAFRRKNVRRTMERLRNEGMMAESWTVGEATDFAWGLLSIHTYEYLVR